ncbi:MAG TPA: DUF3472 domain-containing protein [Chitinophagaceae bacterium]|nr:DUF3472 domain-containing protein [Chitinophagaceae bacterium]
MVAEKKYMMLFLSLIISGSVHSQSPPGKIIVPLGGNSWLTKKAMNGEEKVTESGWENWKHPDAVWSTYIKIQKKGTLKIKALLDVPAGESKLKWTIAGKTKTIIVRGTEKREHEIGEWKITGPGYVKMDAQGINKTGNVFANISELYIEGTAVDEKTAFVKSNEGNYFYWGRRGPSVHINYDISGAGDDIEWFYNEITVPVGSDVIGSYFMAAGFAEGYFGMQVNSSAERRILFSVWSPFTTDNPKEIPQDKKIILLKKGKDVYTGEFGNEGSGGQSYLKYSWKAGEICKFLLKGKPSENNFTTYTAYFYDNQNKQWLLIASFNRPSTQSYLKKLHSFLENFNPETGWLQRKSFYGNQWVRTKSAEWKPLNKMQLTGDATANKGYRLDYDGGQENGKFYLRNCGFFNDSAKLKSVFSVIAPKKIPQIDLSVLE